MKNYLAILLIIIIMSVLFLTIAHITGTFKIDEFFIAKAKENPQIAEWFKTHEDIVNLNTEIVTLKGTISTRDEELTEFVEQMKRLKKELSLRDEKIKDLEERLIDMQQKTTGDNVNVREMAGIYGQMKAEKAAPILQKIDDQMLVQLLKALKKDVAADILSFFPPERAAELTKVYTLWEKD